MAIRFNPLGPQGLLTIAGYAPGGWRVAGALIPGGLAITPEHADRWPVTEVAGLTLADFAFARDAAPGIEVLLIGTGATMIRPAAGLLSALRDAGLAPDFMDSRAAARTYNILVAEGRRVAAALAPLAGTA